MTVLVNKRPAARLSDPTAHGGVITMGLPTVLIGTAANVKAFVAAVASFAPSIAIASVAEPVTQAPAVEMTEKKSLFGKIFSLINGFAKEYAIELPLIMTGAAKNLFERTGNARTELFRSLARGMDNLKIPESLKRTLLRSRPIPGLDGSKAKTGWMAFPARGAAVLGKAGLKALEVVGPVIEFRHALVEAYVLHKAAGDPTQVPELAAKTVGLGVSAIASLIVGGAVSALLVTASAPAVAVVGAILVVGAASVGAAYLTGLAWDRFAQKGVTDAFTRAIDPALPPPAPLRALEAAPAAIAKATTAVRTTARAAGQVMIKTAALVGPPIAAVGLPVASAVTGVVVGAVASGIAGTAASKVAGAVVGAARAAVDAGAAFVRRWF